MRKVIAAFFMVSAAIVILGTQSVFAYEMIEDGCLTCHSKGSLHSLHSVSCTACHPGSAGNTPIPSANCIVCHPPADPGQCDLINNSLAGASHGQKCLGCHTDCESPTEPPTTTCTYSISPTSKTFRASGGKSAVRVLADNGCDWEAISNDSWITITSGASGSGSVRIRYTVAKNPDKTERTGSMDIAGETFTVLQAGRRR